MARSRLGDKLNILCVKWGDRYTIEHVERLHRMCREHIKHDFEFYCYTDQIVDSPINQIQMPDDGLEMWWPKLRLFENNLGLEGRCLYFDLDVTIKSDVTLSLLETIEFHVILSLWFEHQQDVWINSSCMIWEQDENKHIWDWFWKDPEYYMLKYRGIDGFLQHEGFVHKYFRDNIFYSKRFGIKKWDQPKTEPPWYECDRPIEMGNGFHGRNIHNLL